ncbi:MAG: hypothetical protein IPJ19_10240 [Planctomycetes bacterium]|nr:hypothetical protein [Planctomycetota bacterium]
MTGKPSSPKQPNRQGVELMAHILSLTRRDKVSFLVFALLIATTFLI